MDAISILTYIGHTLQDSDPNKKIFLECLENKDWGRLKKLKLKEHVEKFNECLNNL